MPCSRPWAPTAKLTYAQVMLVRMVRRAADEELANMLGVHKRTIQSVVKERSWQVPRAKRLSDDVRTCPVCSCAFSRRVNERRRSDKQWARKLTCSVTCENRRRWQAGVYAQRGK